MLTCDVARVTQAEFRRTRSTDNPLHIVGFLSEWKKYLDHHESLVAEFANSRSGETAEAAAETDRKRQAIGQRMDPSVLETVRPLLPLPSFLPVSGAQFSLLRSSPLHFLYGRSRTLPAR